MNISQALELAKRSMNDLKAKLEDISIKDHYGLVKDLQHTNSPDVFNVVWNSLNKKLSRFWEGIQGIEITHEDGLDKLRDFIYTKTGFYVEDDISPHEGLKAFMSEVANLRM